MDDLSLEERLHNIFLKLTHKMRQSMYYCQTCMPWQELGKYNFEMYEKENSKMQKAIG